MVAKRDARGAALLIVLFGSMLLALLYSVFVRLWLETDDRFHAVFQRTVADFESAEEVKLRASAHLNRPDQSEPPILFTEAAAIRSDFSDALFLKKQARPGLSALASWSRIRKDAAADWCRNTARAAKAPSFHAAQDCVAADEVKNETSFFDGNLRLRSLVLKSDLSSRFVLVGIAGSAEIELLTIDSSVPVDLVVLGDLEIETITFSKRSPPVVRLSSTTGKVRVGTLPRAASLCDGGGGAVSVRLESASGVLIGANSTVTGGKATVGCNLRREPRYWPVTQLLGGPS